MELIDVKILSDVLEWDLFFVIFLCLRSEVVVTREKYSLAFATQKVERPLVEKG